MCMTEGTPPHEPVDDEELLSFLERTSLVLAVLLDNLVDVLAERFYPEDTDRSDA